MATVLLINPSMVELYSNAIVKFSVPHYYPLNLLLIASPLHEAGHKVFLLDLQWSKEPLKVVGYKVKSLKPDYVGLTFTTPLYSQALAIARVVKKVSPKTLVVAGGVHVSTLPAETLKQAEIDIVVLGEGDFTLLEIIKAKNLQDVAGIAYNQARRIIFTKQRELLAPDEIPFPQLKLINVSSYRVPHTYCRTNPVATIETSRGCPYGCVYCNKSVFGHNFRAKSAERVVYELKQLKNFGFREVHIADDGFTNDMERAAEICKLIIKARLKLLLNCTNGIRADRVSLDLLKLMKKAGFYRLSFGVESGSQHILDNIHKGLKLSQVVQAFRWCRIARLETVAFFMLGLPGETKEDIKATIRFAKLLKPDIIKLSIMMPLPGTPIFNQLKQQHRLLSLKWDDYGFYKGKPVFKHEYLTWQELRHYEKLAYRSFYLSPSYITHRLIYSIRAGNLVNDIKLALKSKFLV